MSTELNQKGKGMNNSAVFSSYATADYCGDDFRYQADFTQFLDQEKRSVDQKILRAAHSDDKKKRRKSWKNSLFSWVKINMKPDARRGSVFEPGRGHVSGPVQTTAAKITARSPSSGPLTRRFRPTEDADEFDNVPYTCLGRIKVPHKLQSYGPVYLVT